ncbi:hypothetical protein [Corynebacterium diphtheriae]|uniref:Uncharacterized protein n=2 Tax=Corynebacterium diphtheriae TaxID=1717 RepID=Q6NK74_CORDI|nr:hypothetical protein [Corynebacterium diphtheriae]ARB88509.1 hypothetical protein A6J36_09440 [Corynebacterium diphtheriae]KKA82031.1 hypothetical protein VN94_01180 [Corynebacterium diphtheriae]MBG9294771.1 hypothetical protein [Corynebacterium diphtheriae bv. mitis]MBG9296823.1 hypothetical protein [Corynebacterium diphtheriae bv. gravis]OWM35496.1 hypothetical protein AY602_01605 [Corynebacterium diphtheriae bv. mitis]
MFGFLRKSQPVPQPQEATSDTIATQHTSAPLSNDMMLLMAEEIPMLDSNSRVRVYEILEQYDGPTICSQEELPREIREMMDL